MKRTQQALLGGMLMLGLTGAHAADIANMQVTGIVAPAACTASFGDGSAIDFGSIPVTDLHDDPTSSTRLPQRTISYTITCDMPTIFATSWEDGRAESGARQSFFGLGLQGDTPIGRYRVYQLPSSPPLADGRPATLIVSDDNGATWRAVTEGVQWRDDSRLHGYAAPGSLVPAPYAQVVGTFYVRAAISPTEQLDLSESINVDGLSTMTLFYL